MRGDRLYCTYIHSENVAQIGSHLFYIKSKITSVAIIGKLQTQKYFKCIMLQT